MLILYEYVLMKMLKLSEVKLLKYQAVPKKEVMQMVEEVGKDIILVQS